MVNPNVIQGRHGKRLIVERDADREGRTLVTVVDHRNGKALLANVPSDAMRTVLSDKEGSVRGFLGKTVELTLESEPDNGARVTVTVNDPRNDESASITVAASGLDGLRC